MRIFIFEGDNADRVSVGQVVQVTGSVSEYQDQTQITSTTVEVCPAGVPPALPVTNVTLPFASADYLERYEGMLVTLPQTLYVTEHFQLGRFGQVVLSSGARLQQPTAVTDPGAPALALQAANDLNRIIVDDAFNSQNPDPIAFGRNGDPLSASNTLRGGDTVTGLQGVLTYTWAGNSASGNAYRVRPPDATAGKSPNFQPANARPAAAPDPGGTLRVAGMNLLNFFNTFRRRLHQRRGRGGDRLPGGRHPGGVRPPVAQDGGGHHPDRGRRDRHWRDRERRLRRGQRHPVPGHPAQRGDRGGDVRLHRRRCRYGSGQRPGHGRHQGGAALQAGPGDAGGHDGRAELGRLRQRRR